MDGNKRLAVAATEWFLFRNGFVLIASNEQLLDFSLRVADNRLSRDASTEWIEKRAVRSTWTDHRDRLWMESLSPAELAEVKEALSSAGPRHFLESVRKLITEGAKL